MNYYDNRAAKAAMQAAQDSRDRFQASGGGPYGNYGVLGLAVLRQIANGRVSNGTFGRGTHRRADSMICLGDKQSLAQLVGARMGRFFAPAGLSLAVSSNHCPRLLHLVAATGESFTRPVRLLKTEVN